VTQPDNKLLNLVNAAGFLFQLRVQQEIESTYASHQKSVVAREHRWVDPDSGQEGFIDLVITTGTNGKIVVECKRVSDAEWVFLVPEGLSETHRARVLWTKKFDESRQGAAWDQFKLSPPSLESEFCIVRGQGEGQQPMLERLSSTVLRSTEALAIEELSYSRSAGRTGLRFYFPAIVTTATLHVCRFEPSDIDLLSGKLGDAQFEEVPFIRFTKSLPSGLSSSRPPEKLSESAQESQRTIFVMNAEHLPQTLLGTWEFLPPNMGNRWPWDLPVWKEQAE
jgi:hypothetical protein